MYIPNSTKKFTSSSRWLEDEDGRILKQIRGKAAYSATLVKYAELICRKPCGQAMLYNFEPEVAGGSDLPDLPELPQA